MYTLTSDYTPQGDQPEAIKQLTEALLRGDKYQTLLGVTEAVRRSRFQM